MALIEQESMARIAAEIRPYNGSHIIERPGGWKAVSRRREIQCLECAFPSLGEGSRSARGDEKGAHEQNERFSVAFHRTNDPPGCSWGTFRNQMSCCWIRVATSAAELIT
jgi:hypothetical protein